MSNNPKNNGPLFTNDGGKPKGVYSKTPFTPVIRKDNGQIGFQSAHTAGSMTAQQVISREKEAAKKRNG